MDRAFHSRRGFFFLVAKNATGGAPSRFVVWLALVLLGFCVTAFAGEVIDRIVATVDHRAIVQSEWDDAVRFECLLNDHALALVTAEERRKTLDRIIDQALLSEQMDASSFPHAGAEEIGARIREMREQNASWKTDEGWHRALAAHGLSDEDVAAQVAMQLDMMRFIDLRFRPNIHIDPRNVEEYYVQQLLPELRRSGAAEITLKEASPKIQELLVQQRMDEMLTAWLRNLRQQMPVVVR
jgi:SurA N-terminal domain